MTKILIGLIANGKAGGGIDRYILDFYNEIKSPDIIVDFLSSDYTQELAYILSEQKGKLLVCPKMTNPLGLYKSIKAIVRQNNYDIVYFNYSTALSTPAVMGAKNGGAKKIVVHSHNSNFGDNNKIKEFICKLCHYAIRPLLCKYATDFAACSDKAAIWLFGKRTLKLKKIHYVKNSVKNEDFLLDLQKREFFRQKYNLIDNFVIGNVAGMLKAKNQRFLISLMPKLLEQIPNAVLMLVGDGKDKASLEQLAKTLKVENKVIFTGFLNSTDGIMNAFDVFCLPSLYEGLPYVAVEAQSLKLPCILSDKITTQAALTNACVFIPLKNKLWIKSIKTSINLNRNKIKPILDNNMNDFIEKYDFAHKCMLLN